ncbi:tryptophan 7-halogenase [Sphingomonas sp. RS6]
MFRGNGRIFREHQELFTETSWLSVMSGQGIEPQGYHPIANLLSDSDTLERLRHIAQVIDKTADAMPLQDDCLRRIGCELVSPQRRS